MQVLDTYMESASIFEDNGLCLESIWGNSESVFLNITIGCGCRYRERLRARIDSMEGVTNENK